MNSGCSWFLYELDSAQCVLLNGSRNSLASQCKSYGYPCDNEICDYNKCNQVFDVTTDEGCSVSFFNSIMLISKNKAFKVQVKTQF